MVAHPWDGAVTTFSTRCAPLLETDHGKSAARGGRALKDMCTDPQPRGYPSDQQPSGTSLKMGGHRDRALHDDCIDPPRATAIFSLLPTSWHSPTGSGTWASTGKTGSSVGKSQLKCTVVDKEAHPELNRASAHISTTSWAMRSLAQIPSGRPWPTRWCSRCACPSTSSRRSAAHYFWGRSWTCSSASVGSAWAPGVAGVSTSSAGTSAPIGSVIVISTSSPTRRIARQHVTPRVPERARARTIERRCRHRRCETFAARISRRAKPSRSLR